MNIRNLLCAAFFTTGLVSITFSVQAKDLSVEGLTGTLQLHDATARSLINCYFVEQKSREDCLSAIVSDIKTSSANAADEALAAIDELNLSDEYAFVNEASGVLRSCLENLNNNDNLPESKCDEAAVQDAQKRVDDGFKTAIRDCQGISDTVLKDIDKLEAGEVVAFVKDLNKNPDIAKSGVNSDVKDSVQKCVDGVSKAADKTSDTFAKVTSAILQTLQMCSVIPEPTVCGIIAVIQLLALIFGGDGDGDGKDGNGKNDNGEEGDNNNSGEPGDSTSDSPVGVAPESGGEEQLVVSDDGCKPLRAGNSLRCGRINLDGYYGDAEIIWPVDVETAKSLFEGKGRSIREYMGSFKGELSEAGGIYFCVDQLPGLEAWPTMWQLEFEIGKMYSIYFAQDPGSPGTYSLSHVPSKVCE